MAESDQSSGGSIVLVGHCGPDTAMLKSMLYSAAPGRPIVMANDAGSLADALPTAALLLVNRVLDGVFEDDSGLALIEGVASSEDAPPVMLISNYEDAQAQAVAVGARQGFGKTAVNNPNTRAMIADAIGPAS